MADDHLLQTITASLATAVTEERLIENTGHADLNSLIWTGNMTARIGIVISHESSLPVVGRHHEITEGKDTSPVAGQLPWSLAGCGFNASNTLL